MIIESPKNTTAAVGTEVTFYCRFNGTVDLPLWSIGGKIYLASQLPPGFKCNKDGVSIPAVWESLNNTVFICLFNLYDGDGKLLHIESFPAYLVVYSKNSSEKQLSAASSTDTTWTNTPTIVNRIYESSINTYSSGDHAITKCKICFATAVGKSNDYVILGHSFTPPCTFFQPLLLL